MKVYLYPKNPFVPEPELEVDELTLFPENDNDREKCQTILEQAAVVFRVTVRFTTFR